MRHLASIGVIILLAIVVVSQYGHQLGNLLAQPAPIQAAPAPTADTSRLEAQLKALQAQLVAQQAQQRIVIQTTASDPSPNVARPPAPASNADAAPASAGSDAVDTQPKNDQQPAPAPIIVHQIKSSGDPIVQNDPAQNGAQVITGSGACKVNSHVARRCG